MTKVDLQEYRGNVDVLHLAHVARPGVSLETARSVGEAGRAALEDYRRPEILDNKSKESYSLPVMKSTISSKGQVTVPAEVRDKLGLTPGSVVQFEVREGGAFMKKGHRGDHPVDAIYGRLKLDRSVDEILDAMRGPRPSRTHGTIQRPRQKQKKK